MFKMKKAFLFSIAFLITSLAGLELYKYGNPSKYKHMRFSGGEIIKDMYIYNMHGLDLACLDISDISVVWLLFKTIRVVMSTIYHHIN
jgi:hypothetical protein